MSKKVDEFRKVEKWLYDYKKLDGYIAQIDLRIRNIENSIIGCRGISYDSDKLSKSYNINKQVEDEVIRRQEEIEKLELQKKSLISHKKSLDTAIHNLNSDQTILFNLVYINKDKWSRDRIISEMHISKDTYYRLKKTIVYSVIDTLNPDRILKEIEERFGVK